MAKAQTLRGVPIKLAQPLIPTGQLKRQIIVRTEKDLINVSMLWIRDSVNLSSFLSHFSEL